MNNVLYIHSEDEWKACLEVNEQEGNLLVVCFGATWCGPCRALKPRFEALATQFASNIMFVKVDIEECPELAEQYEITSLPTTLVFQDKKIKSITVGANLLSIENSIVNLSSVHLMS